MIKKKYDEEDYNLFLEWNNEEIPDFEGKERFVNFLTNIFISSKIDKDFKDYIQPYVEKHFKFTNNKWAVAIKTIKNNYKYFRILGWSGDDYLKCLSLIILLDKKLSRKELIAVYNDYKMGWYDNYFIDTEEFNFE